MLICHWPSVPVRLIACIVRWNGISLHGWLNSSSIQDKAVCELVVSRMIQDLHPDHFHSITRTMRWNPDGWWEIRSDGLSNVTQITCAKLESWDQMNRTWDTVLGGREVMKMFLSQGNKFISKCPSKYCFWKLWKLKVYLLASNQI